MVFLRIWKHKARPAVTSSSVSSFAPVQSAEHLIYTAAPSDRPYSAVGYPPGSLSLPVPVSGSGSGGVQGQQGRPLYRGIIPPDFSTRLPRAGSTSGQSYGGDRSWGAPSSWGAFGEGAPTAVGDQNFLGQYHGVR